MNETAMMYVVLGFILAAAGFGVYAMQVFQAYNREKRKIKEDFELSKMYEPEKAMQNIMVFIMIGSTGIVYVMLLSMFLSLFPEAETTVPNAYSLSAKFVMIMGATALIANLSRIFIVARAVQDLAYMPVLSEATPLLLCHKRHPIYGLIFGER